MRLFRWKRKKQPYAPPKAREIPTEMYFDIVRQNLEACGRAVVRVTGVSMKPFLHPVRDTVTIAPLSGGLKRGDIPLFDTRRGRYILHRVTRAGERDFDMRGDNTARGEKGLPTALVVGVVQSANRKGRVIEAGSALWRAYACFAPVHRAWVALWHRGVRPALAKTYRLVIPRKTEENNHA